MVVVEMKAMGMPWPLVLAVLLLQWTNNISHTSIEFAEFFAGRGEQSKALGDVGLHGHAHDLLNGLDLRLSLQLFADVCVLCLCAVTCVCLCREPVRLLRQQWLCLGHQLSYPAASWQHRAAWSCL